MVEHDHASMVDKKIGFWTSFGIAVWEFIQGWVEHNHGVKNIAYEMFDAAITIGVGGFLAATIAYHTRKYWTKKDKNNP